MNCRSLFLFCLLPIGCLKVPTSKDNEEVNRIVEALESRYHFSAVPGQDTRPAVFMKPHPNYTIIFVYGGYSPDKRGQIIAAAQAARKEHGTKPVHLYIYPRKLDNTDLLQEAVLR